MYQHMGAFLFSVPMGTFTWQAVHATIVPGMASMYLGRNFLSMWELVARRALLALSVLLAAFLGYLLLRNADSMPSSQPLAPESIEQADAKIEKFIFTQSKGDVVQWQVQAEQAKLFEQDKRAVLRDVALTFYSTEGEEVIVHGEEGTLDTATKDFRLANRQTPLIVETRSGYTIYTNHLVWTDKLREIRTEDSVRMVGHGLEVRGQGLLGRMETEEFEVLRDVHVDLAPSS
jgi:LPS export ABC transporter protein LptC